MSCRAITTGQFFLGDVLAHLDCQGRSIGVYGYGALSAAGSTTHQLLLPLLAIFIALFGIRLLFGPTPGPSDLVGSIIKIGIVLTLAMSWPAWRTLAYDVVLNGPAQVTRTIGASAALPGTQGDLDLRLENLDRGIVALTTSGTGRLTGGIAGNTDRGDPAKGVALDDQSGLGWGRVVFLVGTIGPLALVRLGAGILLALAPLLSGLLLFGATRDLFVGWLRGLTACLLGALSLTIVYAVQLTLMESWLTDALAQREANRLTPSTPTELIVFALAFCLLAWASLGLVFRIAFFAQYWPSAASAFSQEAGKANAEVVYRPTVLQARQPIERLDLARANLVSAGIARNFDREERFAGGRRPMINTTQASGTNTVAKNDALVASTLALGDSFRRNYSLGSGAARRRDDVR